MLPILIGVFAALFAVTTILERKGLGRIQNRYGPNRVGPFGFLQPAADGIKALIKEDVVPASADKVIHFLAPLGWWCRRSLVYAVLPIGRNMVLVDLDAGVLFFFAIGAATELSVFMAGWSSRNKYSLLGAMRAIAQMISYEIPLILSRGDGHHDRRLALHRRKSSTRQAGYHAVGLPQLVCVHAVGFGGFHFVHDRRHGGIQPLAI